VIHAAGLRASAAQPGFVQRARLEFTLATCFALGVAGVLWMTQRVYFTLGLLLLGIVLVAWAIRPFVGLALSIFFGLAGDGTTAEWYPAIKNFSSEESILYLHPALTITPLDVMVYGGFVIWLLRFLATRDRPFRAGVLFLPLVPLTGMLLFGLLYGLGKGGDPRVAVFEVRSILLVPVTYVLVLNCCTSTRQIRSLMWIAMASVVVHALLSVQYLTTLTSDERESLTDLNEHSASVHINVLVMLVLMAFLLRGVRPTVRMWLLLASIAPAYIWMVNQRRSAVVGLAFAVILFVHLLRRHQRRTFRWFVPLLLVVTAGYLGAFWNATSGIGLPAQAVKTVIAGDDLSSDDRGSDLYRIIENYDLNYTIRSSPLFGVGFGREFYRPIPLSDISVFEFNASIPHNSIMFIWLKAGVIGFIALFFLLARAMMAGSQAIGETHERHDLLVVAAAVMFVGMWSVYAFVDIAWDARSCLFLGLSLAIISAANRRVSAHLAGLQRRIQSTVRRVANRPTTKLAAGRLPARAEQ
jgi:O-antigen ligase